MRALTAGKGNTKAMLDIDQDLFDKVLIAISSGREPPVETVVGMKLTWGGLLAWCNRDVERLEKLKAAVEIWATVLGMDTVRIADSATNEDVSAKALQVKARQWVSSRLNPRWFGEHTKVEHSGTVTNLMAVLSSLPTRGEIDVTPEVIEERA